MADAVATTFERFAGARCVVFGACGFMGSHTTKALVALGADVVAFDFSDGEVAVGATQVQGDITDAESVRAVVEGASHLFCFAGGLGPTRSLADPVRDLETSARAQLMLLETMRAVAPKASVVLAGSRLEYGTADHLPVDETHPLRPGNPYAFHKALCSHYYSLYAARHGLHATVLRLSNPYGPHALGGPASTGYGVLNFFVDLAKRDDAIQLFGDGEQLRDFIHVDDVVSAALAASLVPEAAGLAFNIGSGVGTSLREAAETVVELCGSGRVVAGVEWPEDARLVETGDFYFDVGLAERVLGWRPCVALHDGLVSLLRP
ncbi:MAG TPA: NAD-dependent epimerase/dehydratase family protein [Coriobacteriia bacterium]|nr:NAD-dependent epimerase/dehydratase family protein [Coriobacteriia bacterium]